MKDAVHKPPWNLMVGFVLLTGICVALARVFGLWLLVIPVLMAAAYLTRRAKRTVGLRRKSYFGGRRAGTYWVYEEIRDGRLLTLELPMENTEPGHYELFVPEDAAWRAAVPEWAADRRDEIVHRIAERLKSADLHLPDDMTPSRLQ